MPLYLIIVCSYKCYMMFYNHSSPFSFSPTQWNSEINSISLDCSFANVLLVDGICSLRFSSKWTSSSNNFLGTQGFCKFRTISPLSPLHSCLNSSLESYKLIRPHFSWKLYRWFFTIIVTLRIAVEKLKFSLCFFPDRWIKSFVFLAAQSIHRYRYKHRYRYWYRSIWNSFNFSGFNM